MSGGLRARPDGWSARVRAHQIEELGLQVAAELVVLVARRDQALGLSVDEIHPDAGARRRWAPGRTDDCRPRARSSGGGCPAIVRAGGRPGERDRGPSPWPTARGPRRAPDAGGSRPGGRSPRSGVPCRDSTAPARWSRPRPRPAPHRARRRALRRPARADPPRSRRSQDRARVVDVVEVPELVPRAVALPEHHAEQVPVGAVEQTPCPARSWPRSRAGGPARAPPGDPRWRSDRTRRGSLRLRTARRTRATKEEVRKPMNRSWVSHSDTCVTSSSSSTSANGTSMSATRRPARARSVQNGSTSLRVGRTSYVPR